MPEAYLSNVQVYRNHRGIIARGPVSRHKSSPSDLFRKTLPTDEALAGIKDTASKTGNPQFPNNIIWVLERNKRRQVYETIGILFHQKGAIPAICGKVLDALNEMWLNKRPLGQYQFDASGNLSSYTPS